MLKIAAGTCLGPLGLRMGLSGNRRRREAFYCIRAGARSRASSSFCVLSALVRLQSKDADWEAAAALEATSHRILVLAEACDHLALRDDARLVSVRDDLAEVCAKLITVVTEPVALVVQADEACVPSNRAVPLAMAARFARLTPNSWWHGRARGDIQGLERRKAP